MSKSREIAVTEQDPQWQEYDREVLVAIWNNKYQPTVIDISREEAANLRDLIENFLRPAPLDLQCAKVADVEYGQELRCSLDAGHYGKCKP